MWLSPHMHTGGRLAWGWFPSNATSPSSHLAEVHRGHRPKAALRRAVLVAAVRVSSNNLWVTFMRLPCG